MTQLPKLFGVKGGGGNFLERVVVLGSQLPGTNLAVLAQHPVHRLPVVGVAGERAHPGRGAG